MLREGARRWKDNADLLVYLAHLLSCTSVVELRDPRLGLQLARSAVELKPNTLTRQALGWAQYRMGDWRGCIKTLEKLQLDHDGGDYFAAMAYWQLGDKALARSRYDRTDKWLPQYEEQSNRSMKKLLKGDISCPDPVLLRYVRVEAAALLGVKLSQAAVRSKAGPEPASPPN